MKWLAHLHFYAFGGDRKYREVGTKENSIMSDQKLHIQAHTGSDGMVHLDISTGIINKDIELEVSFEPKEQTIALEGLSPAEKAKAFRAWAESHSRGLPLLSDEAISRESIYSDEQL